MNWEQALEALKNGYTIHNQDGDSVYLQYSIDEDGHVARIFFGGAPERPLFPTMRDKERNDWVSGRQVFRGYPVELLT